MKETFFLGNWPTRAFAKPEVPSITIGAKSVSVGLSGAVYSEVVSGEHGNWAAVDQSDYMTQVYELNKTALEQNWQLEKQFRAAFGYAERVSELCKRLEKIESVLLDVVTKLDRSSQSQRSIWVPIESFAPEPFEVIKPFTVVVNPADDGFEASLYDANLYSSGDTEAEAVNNLKSVILDTHTMLEQLDESKLGPGPLKQRNALASLVRRTVAAG